MTGFTVAAGPGAGEVVLVGPVVVGPVLVGASTDLDDVVEVGGADGVTVVGAAHCTTEAMAAVAAAITVVVRFAGAGLRPDRIAEFRFPPNIVCQSHVSRAAHQPAQLNGTRDGGLR